MRVIKDGRKAAKAAKPKRYTCGDCSSVLEVSRDDMSAQTSDRDGSYYTFKCPVCGHQTYVDARVVDGKVGR